MNNLDYKNQRRGNNFNNKNCYNVGKSKEIKTYKLLRCQKKTLHTGAREMT